MSEQQTTTTAQVALPRWTGEDKVELPLSQFVNMLTSFEKYEDIVSHIENMEDVADESKPPSNFLVQELRITGETHQRQRYVGVVCEFRINVLVDQYNTCPLLYDGGSSLVVEKVVVDQLTIGKGTGKNTDKGDEIMQVLPNYFGDVSEHKVAEEEHGGQIGVLEGYHSLITTQKGLYSVSLHISVPFASTQQKSVQLSFAHDAARSKITDFKMEGDMQVQIEPSSYMRTKVTEKSNKGKSVDSYDSEDDLDDSIDSHETIIEEATFPSTRSLKIYWTRNEVKQVVQPTTDDTEQQEQQEPEVVEEQKPLIVNVDQNTLHSVGGGIVSALTEFTFQILNGSYDTFFIVVNYPAKSTKAVRILRVEGNNIKKWEVKKYKASQLAKSGSSDAGLSQGSLATPTPTPNASDDEQTVVKVMLDCGVAGDYRLKINAEVDMEKESAKVHIPTFTCLNVNREKGFIGIEATSSVEIKELATKMLTKLDTRELPQELINKASDQMIFGYKFLQSKGTALYVDVKKHDDVAVLVAVIEEAYYEVTYSPSGHFFYHVVLKVKNTTQDYVKIRLLNLPPTVQKNIETSLWSTGVSGASMRPAKDKEGNILLPLKRSAEENIFTIELFYLYKDGPALKGQGELELYFPTFNTPITRAYYALHLPQNFNYGEFEGDLKECKYFTSSPTVISMLQSDKGNVVVQAPISQRKPQKKMISLSSRNAMPQMQMQMQQQAMPPPVMPQQMLMNAMPRAPLRRRASFSYEENELVYSDEEDDMNYDSAESDSEEDEDDWNDDDEDDSRVSDQPRSGSSGSKSLSSSVLGVLPVSMQAVNVGKTFYFEKLLVTESEPSLRVSVQYRELFKSWREKRSLFPFKQVVYGSILALFALVILYWYIRRRSA